MSHSRPLGYRILGLCKGLEAWVRHSRPWGKAFETRVNALETKVNAFETRVNALETRVNAFETRGNTNRLCMWWR